MCQFLLFRSVKDQAEDDEDAGEINQESSKFRGNIPESGTADCNVSRKFILPGQGKEMSKVAYPQTLLHNRAGGTAKNKSHRYKEYHAAGSYAGIGGIPSKEQTHHSDGRDIEALGQEKQKQAACESHVIQEMKDDHADGKGRHEADTIRDETDEYGKRLSYWSGQSQSV